MKLFIISTTEPNEQCMVGALSQMKLSVSRYKGSAGPLSEKGIMLVVSVDDDIVEDVINKLKITCEGEDEVVEPPAQEAQVGEFVADTPIEIKRHNTVLYVLPIESALSW